MNYNNKYLKEKREANGLFKRELANRLKMNESNYGKVEHGLYKNIPLKILIKLKQELDLDLNKLIVEQGN